MPRNTTENRFPCVPVLGKSQYPVRHRRVAFERRQVAQEMPDELDVDGVPAAGGVRRDEAVWRRPERIGWRQGLRDHDVEVGGADAAGLQALDKRDLVDRGSPSHVVEARAGL